jgi:phospholipase C
MWKNFSIHSLKFLFTAAAMTVALQGSRPALAEGARLAHIFVIVEENHGYDQIIGNPNAPNINRLARDFGNATRFYAEVHPSEPNYVAILAGDTFGIHDDDAFFCTIGSTDAACPHAKRPNFKYANHTIVARSLIDQLNEHGLSWKGYFESIPEPGSRVESSRDQLYASKHNGFMNLAVVQKIPDLAKRIVGFDQLTKDLATGDVPNYAHIIPNQCNEMHGLDEGDDPPSCRYDHDAALISRADRVVGELVARIQASPIWQAPENTAIVITWDEDDGPHPTRDAGKVQGCCGFDPKNVANAGGGHIPTIVITNHGPRGVKDDTPYNHYSLLRTTEEAFGITEHLNSADDAAGGVVSMSKLFWK